MGLTHRARANLSAAAAALAVTGALTYPACVQELPIQQTDTALPYVDGAVLLDSTTQSLALGITDGIRVRGEVISDATVEVHDLTTGAIHDYRHVGDGRYVATFRGVLDHAYQLRLDIPALGTFRSRPDSLAAPTYDLSAEAGLQRRLTREGETVTGNVVTGDLTVVTRPGRSPAGVLTVRPYVIWSYADQVCDPFDNIGTCYFVERPEFAPFATVDLADFSADGDTALVSVGAEPLDYRWAGDAFVALETRRYSPAATAYFTALSRTLNPTGSPLDERPLPTVGNVASESNGRGLLGFFGVADARVLYASGAASLQAQGRRVAGPCAGARRGIPTEIDCCYCDLTPGALTERPSYLP